MRYTNLRFTYLLMQALRLIILTMTLTQQSAQVQIA